MFLRTCTDLDLQKCNSKPLKMCAKTNEVTCKDVPEDICETSIEVGRDTQCIDILEEVCNIVEEDVCKEEYVKKCKRGPHGKPVCNSVPVKKCHKKEKQVCNKVPVPKCLNVPIIKPRRNCNTVLRQKCTPVEKQQCLTVYKTECQQETSQLCLEVPETTCEVCIRWHHSVYG